MAQVSIPLESHEKFGNWTGMRRIELPSVCIVCGTPTRKSRKVTFSKRYFMGRYVKSIHTSVPLCREDWDHFRPMWLYGLIIFLGAFLLMIVGILLAVMGLTLGILLGIGGVFGAIVLYIPVSIYLKSTHVHAAAINRDELVLNNVAEEFVEGVERLWGEHDDLDSAIKTPSGSGNVGSKRRKRPVDDEEESPQYEGLKYLPFIIVGGIALVILLAFCVVGTIFLTVFRTVTNGPAPIVQNNKNNNKNGQQGNNQNQFPWPAELRNVNALPLNPLWKEDQMQRQYLSDMQEMSPRVGWGRFAKNGMNGFTTIDKRQPFLFKGQAYPKGLAMHAVQHGFSTVKYRLNGEWKMFKSYVALADFEKSANRKKSENPFVFAVLGDNRVLWKSRIMQNSGDFDLCQISVEGVRELELRAYDPMGGGWVWSAWLDPQVLK